MVKTEEDLKKFLEEVNNKNTVFNPHFYEKQKDRQYLSEDLVINALKNKSNFIGFQDQSKEGKEKYRIGVKLSGKYDLVVVGEIKDNKHLNIITAWKTSRKWQKSIQK